MSADHFVFDVVSSSRLSKPCLLALDTATETVHLGLIANENKHVSTFHGGARATATALPGLHALLTENGLAWTHVQAIAFGQGPGAFTGLRTACALAQGLALGLNIPVLPLNTMMAVAESARLRSADLVLQMQNTKSQAPIKLWVLQDARMHQVYAEAYIWYEIVDNGKREWRVQEPVALWDLATLQDHIASGYVQYAAGSALAAYPEHTKGLSYADPLACPEGSALLALALTAWQNNACVDAANALPVYVRDKVAQTTQERQQANAY